MDLSDESPVWIGGCRCGKVRFRVSTRPLLTLACHCSGCQRMTGGAYALAVMVADEGFQVTSGEPVAGGMRGEIAHMHCPDCLGWVFTRPPGIPFVNIRTPMLDEPNEFAPFIDMWLAEKLSWVVPTAEHQFERFPGPGDWRGLMAQYAAEHRV